MGTTARRCIVTGGCGFVGTHLVRRLRGRGDHVVVVDDLSAAPRPEAGGGDDGPPLIVGSVDAPEVLEAAFEAAGGAVDTVFHLASVFANARSLDEPHADLRTTAAGALTVLEACRRQPEPPKVVFTSTSCAREPTTPYAAAKRLAETYMALYRTRHGLPITVCRLFNVYGPGEIADAYRGVVPLFLERASRGEPLPITGTGDETRDFTFIDDTVEALCRAGSRPPPHAEDPVVDIGTGVETSVARLAEIVLAHFPGHPPPQRRPQRSWDRVTRRRADTAVATRHLGFSPAVGLEEGIARTVAWWVGREGARARPAL
jgi:UDP-glucose 4-epimerase